MLTNLFLALAALAPQEGRVFESDAHGFAIERPEEWAFSEKASNALGRYELTVYLPARAGLVAATVQVDGAIHVDDAAQAVERALARAGEREELSELRALEDPAGLSARYESEVQGTFRIEQRYLVERGKLYILQAHAPVDEFDEWKPALDDVLATFRWRARSPEAEQDARRRALVSRCGSEVEFARDWQQAAARARDERKAVLVCVRQQGGFELPDAIRTATFMDPDMIALAQERVVPLILTQGMDAPFVAQEAYGMGPSTFGTALLFCSPEGAVLHETIHLDPLVADAFLREWLTQLPEYSGAPIPEGIGAMERAKLCFARGELLEARTSLQGLNHAQAHLLRARLHRRERDGSAALASIASARDATGAEELAPELAEEELTILMRLGKDEDARALAESLIEEISSAAPVARLWLGVLATRAGNSDAARAYWNALVDELPEERAAWSAAAALASPVLELGLPIPTEFPDEDILADQRARPSDPGASQPLERLEATALAWLLRQQRPDGSWQAARHSARSAGLESNPFADSVTAICGMAALERGERGAAERALSFVLAARARRAASERPVVFMDYTVYADAWISRFLADALDAELGDEAALRTAIDEHLVHMGAKQRENGGWSYYLSGSASAGAAVVPQSISFITGLATLALLRAEEVGAEVPAAMRAGALDCLEAMRGPRGTFEYMLAVGSSATDPGAPGAAGRGPLCELALLRGGRSDPERLRNSLELFEAHSAGLAKEVGKALMHCGPAAQGCHYVLFDYQTAAEAVAQLPEGQRGRFRALLVERLLATRSVDGSFRDTPINGWCYGTAMALLALADLAE